MITNKRPKKTRIEIDLSGPQGNAFTLLGIAKDLSNKLGYDWDIIHEQMISNDYEWLIQTMDSYFGDHIIMYR
jgi:hypothetical protein